MDFFLYSTQKSSTLSRYVQNSLQIQNDSFLCNQVPIANGFQNGNGQLIQNTVHFNSYGVFIQYILLDTDHKNRPLWNLAKRAKIRPTLSLT